jgi:hypothetical protein
MSHTFHRALASPKFLSQMLGRGEQEMGKVEVNLR